MQADAVGRSDERITQGLMSLQAVEPGPDLRIGITHICQRTFHIFSSVIRSERIVKHIKTSYGKNGKNASQGREEGDENSFFILGPIYPMQRKLVKVTSQVRFYDSSIFGSFFMKSVVLGL